MGKVTFVVKYKDELEPAVSFDMKIAGGQLSAVLWRDYRDDLLSADELDILEDALEKYEDIKFGEEIKSFSQILEKLRLLTI